jgi:hypothetical protein
MQEQTNKTKRPWSRARSSESGKRKSTGQKKSIYDKLMDIEDLVEMIARQLAREAKLSKNNGGAEMK